MKFYRQSLELKRGKSWSKSPVSKTIKGDKIFVKALIEPESSIHPYSQKSCERSSVAWEESDFWFVEAKVVNALLHVTKEEDV